MRSVALAAGPAAAEISYAGSSTIGLVLMPDAARAFTLRTGIPFGSVEIQGTGRGIEMVARGEAPLAGASRALTATEKKAGLRYQIIGYDAVGVYVNALNRVQSVTRPQLKDVFTGGITNWKELGGQDARIVVLTAKIARRGGQSVEFQAHVLNGLPYRADRREITGGQTELAAALVAEPHGINTVSPAFARPGMKAIALEGFHPTLENVRSGAYVLSRPLVLVAPPHPTPEVRRFLDFMLGAEGQAIVARHFVSLH